jgi:hypothetical protein
MSDIDSAGVYFLSIEEFEARKPARERDDDDATAPSDQADVETTKSARTRPSSSPQSS